MSNTMANDNSPFMVLLIQQQNKDHFSLGPPLPSRLPTDDPSFVGPSPTLPSPLPTLPFEFTLHESPLSCIVTDNSPITPSEELDLELVDYCIRTPNSNDLRRSSKTHDIHVVLLHYFCDI